MRYSKQAATKALGLGCFLWLMLMALLSGALFGDIEEAAAFQTMLTTSFDGGVLAGFALCLVARRRRPGVLQSRRGRLSLLLIDACGLSTAVMLRAGMLFSGAPFDLVIGDMLWGLFLALTAAVWWDALLQDDPDTALLSMAWALGGASLAFIAMSLLPRGVLLLAASLIVPAIMALSLADTWKTSEVDASEGADEPGGNAAPSLPFVLFGSIVSTVFVADLLLSLFPVSLYHEGSPLFAPITGDASVPTIGNLTEPALIGAVLLAAFSAFFGWAVVHSALKLSVLCAVGFFAVAVGFVTFPYHLPGGAPIGIAEAGRCIILVFIYTLLRLYLRGRDGHRWSCAVLRLAAASSLSALVADFCVTTLYLTPAFDYLDFQMRTVFGGAGVLVLVALLLVPMPHVYEVVRTSAPRQSGDGGSVFQTEAAKAPFDSVAALSERYRLSPRESEIVGLISQGRDVPYIEQELVLSKSTVKTHIRHIYEKCSVSSRQDLLDLLHEQDEGGSKP